MGRCCPAAPYVTRCSVNEVALPSRKRNQSQPALDPFHSARSRSPADGPDTADQGARSLCSRPNLPDAASGMTMFDLTGAHFPSKAAISDARRARIDGRLERNGHLGEKEGQGCRTLRAKWPCLIAGEGANLKGSSIEMAISGRREHCRPPRPKWLSWSERKAKDAGRFGRNGHF